MVYNSICSLVVNYPKGSLITISWTDADDGILKRCIVKVDKFETDDSGVINVIGDGVTAGNTFEHGIKFGVSGNDVSYSVSSDIELYKKLSKGESIVDKNKFDNGEELFSDVMDKISKLVSEYGYHIKIDVSRDFR